MNLSLRYIAASLLLIIFSFAIVPSALLHSFTDHTDSPDCYSAETTIHTEHQHCSILQLNLPPYFSCKENFFLHDFSAYRILASFIKEQFVSSEFYYFSLRAPPAVMA